MIRRFLLQTRFFLLCSSLALAFTTASAAPRTPADIFGFEPGDDYMLASYEQMESYYRQLAAESPRVQLRIIGQSVLERPLFLLTISSEENLANLDRYRSISAQLARARIDESAAESLSVDGKAVVWIDGGLHATELAHGQMTPLLAHRVATEESVEMRHIRDNVIFLLMPVMNPDGLEIVRKWYQSQLDTPFEQTTPPELYHHYVGHDNNRDFFMNNMPESKAVAKVLYNEWYPQIVYNQHQSSPGYARIVIPPYSDPVNPIIHPGVTTALNEIGSAMGNRFALRNMPGAISDVGYSMWWNGGMRTVPYFHNMIGILTETGHDSPSPRFYDPKTFPKMLATRANPGGVGITVPDDVSGVPDARVLYSQPWEGGESHFRDPINYMITGSIAVLRAAADSRLKWLNNIYHMGRDSIEAGQSGNRFYVIPSNQNNWDEARNLVNILREGGVEIERSNESFRAAGQQFATGSYIVPAAQAFRPYVVDLLEPQVYPDTRTDPNGEIRPPYDIAGWTLPMQMGVEIVTIESDLRVDSSPIDELGAPEPGDVSGRAGFGFALSGKTNLSSRAINRLLAQGETVMRAHETFRAGRTEMPAGTFIVVAGEQTGDRVSTVANNTGLDFVGLASDPDVESASIHLPRVGLYKSYVASMDEGWTRWLFDDYEFDVVSLSDNDLRDGRLDSVDAVVLPHPDGRVYFKDSVGKMLTGHPAGTMPDEYTGGMGVEGAHALNNFVSGGGTLLAFGDSVDFAIEQFGLPIRDVVVAAAGKDFSIPGSLIRTRVDTSNPLTYGVDGEVAVNFVRGAAFDVLGQANCVDDLLNQRHCFETTRGGRSMKDVATESRFNTVARYADDDLLMSGWAAGTEHIAGKTAMAQVPHGNGQVIVYGFRPQFRGQPRATYKLIFNALYGAAED